MRAVQVQFTIDDLARGEEIALELLNTRLVACVQTEGPVTSRYWWDGSINQTQEWVFVCKTTPARLDDVIERVRARHPYEVPEIVAHAITGGLEEYDDWIVTETRS
jgi:periplasmic divalent cation tolerance protein